MTTSPDHYSEDDEDDIDDGYDSESCAETDSSYEFEHRLDEKIDNILSDPAGAMARLKRLHETRIHLGTNAELHIFMEALGDFLWPLQNSDDAVFRTDHPITKELVKHGLLELILDVAANGLFNEGLDYVCSILTIVITLVFVVKNEPENPSDQDRPASSATSQCTIFDKIISNLLRATWDARDLLRIDDDNREDGALNLVRGLLLTLLLRIQYDRLGEPGWVDLRGVAAFLWLSVDEELDRRAVLDSNKCFVIGLVTFALRGKTGWKGVKPFMEDLCDMYGGLRVLERLTSTYLQFKSLSEDEGVAFLYWTPRLLNTPQFYPYFKTTGIFVAVRAVYDERMGELEGRGDLEMEITTINAVVWMAYHMTKVAPFQDGPMLLVKQCGILELMGHFVVLHSKDKRALRSTENPPRRVIEVFTDVARALNLRSGKNEFRKRFKLLLRREWYPTLKVLRETKDAGPQRQSLEEAWQSFGDAMNLDEAREKHEYELDMKRAADRRCSWRDCEYHVKKPPKTRACVGCNEARYCSKACQRKDWREGGHRAQCKRLKDVPQSFIEMQEREENRNVAESASSGTRRLRSRPFQ
ncbi:hypothetical protein PENSPDRAFT_651748 [Peniophora sp. CONT]|nr:hypothetical protein PENSPDRAFT_651748 [Peniophora sp. CONT]